MPDKKEILAFLSPFENKQRVVTWRQSADDIIDNVINVHEEFVPDYDAIYQLFDTGDIYDTCRGLWEFCKYNLTYKIETEKNQTLKSPAGILEAGGIDCKHYSLFMGGVLDAIQAHHPENWDWSYRFCSDSKDQRIGHVFIVVRNGSKEIWLDPVLSSFDERKNYTYYIDEKPMALYVVSGVTDDGLDGDVVIGKKKAEQDFLVAVNLNLYGMRDLLNKYPDILNGQVRSWYLSNGFDFNQLQLILANGFNGSTGI